MDSRSVLEQVRSGKLSVAEAERYFNRKAYENLNYARLDTSREQRTGFAEVVYCSGKPDAYLADIYKRLWRSRARCSARGQRRSSMNWCGGSCLILFMTRWRGR